MSKIETPEKMAERLYPEPPGGPGTDAEWRQVDRHEVAAAAIRADREQIRAALLDFAEAIDENSPDLADVLADLRALAAKLGGTDG